MESWVLFGYLVTFGVLGGYLSWIVSRIRARRERR
jgi:hypothetical protein